MLQSDQYGKLWHYDSDIDQVYGSVIRSWTASINMGVTFLLKRHHPRSKSDWRWPSLETPCSLWRDVKLAKHCCTRRTASGISLEVADDNNSDSGSTSLVLGDTRRNGCSESPDWDSDVDLESVEEEEEEEEEEDRERVEDRLQQVIESPLWALLRDFLTSDDVLHMRTTGIKLDIGSFLTEFFFFLKNDEKDKPVLPPEWPSLLYHNRQFWGLEWEVGVLWVACQPEKTVVWSMVRVFEQNVHHHGSIQFIGVRSPPSEGRVVCVLQWFHESTLVGASSHHISCVWRRRQVDAVKLVERSVAGWMFLGYNTSSRTSHFGCCISVFCKTHNPLLFVQIAGVNVASLPWHTVRRRQGIERCGHHPHRGTITKIGS